MSKDVYVVSKMTDSVSYCFYDTPINEKDTPALRGKITIRGGAGLPSNRSGFGELGEDTQGMPLWIADGIVTRVSDSNYDRLKEHPLFQRHLKAGRLRVMEKDVSGNHKEVRKISADMPELDSHSLLNKSNIKQRVGKGTPTVKNAGADDFMN